MRTYNKQQENQKMNLAKINEAIRDLENQCKVAIDNEDIVESVCRLLECIPAEITDKVRTLCQANLGFDDNLAEAEKNRESIEKDALLMAVSESIVEQRHVIYESEPSMESDCYGDEVTITLRADETSIEEHLDYARANWEDYVEAVQDERRRKEQEAKERAEAKAKLVADAENNQQQGNCSEGV